MQNQEPDFLNANQKKKKHILYVLIDTDITAGVNSTQQSSTSSIFMVF